MNISPWFKNSQYSWFGIAIFISMRPPLSSAMRWTSSGTLPVTGLISNLCSLFCVYAFSAMRKPISSSSTRDDHIHVGLSFSSLYDVLGDIQNEHHWPTVLLLIIRLIQSFEQLFPHVVLFCNLFLMRDHIFGLLYCRS